MKIAVVSGGFDPLHSGHVNYLEQAATFGDKLVVLVNSDEWLTRKKGRPFMPFEERSLILGACVGASPAFIIWHSLPKMAPWSLRRRLPSLYNMALSS